MTKFIQNGDPKYVPLNLIMRQGLGSKEINFVGGVYSTDDPEEISFIQEYVQLGYCRQEGVTPPVVAKPPNLSRPQGKITITNTAAKQEDEKSEA